MSKFNKTVILFLLFGENAVCLGREKCNQTELNQLEVAAWTMTESKLFSVENKITKCIQVDPRDAMPFFLLTRISIRMFQYSPDNFADIRKASMLAQQTLELDPHSDLGYIALADTLDAMGQNERGIALLNDATTRVSEPSWRFYYSMARLNAQRSSIKEVLGTFEQALAFRNAEPKIIVPYIVAVLQTGLQGDDLLQNLYAWQQRYPNALFREHIAAELAEQKQYEKAHKIFRDLYQSDANNFSAMFADAIILSRHMNEANSANAIFEKLLAANFAEKDLPQQFYADLYAAYGVSLLNSGSPDRAKSLFIKSLRRSDNQDQSLEFVVSSYRSAGMAKKLPLVFKDLIASLREPNGFAYALIGETQSEDLGDHVQALKSFSDAILIEPNRSEYYNGFGLTYTRLDKWDEALAQFNQASKIDPTNATAIYNDACALSKLGRAKESLQALESALELNPQLADLARRDKDFGSLAKSAEFKRIVASVYKDLPVQPASTDDLMDDVLGH